MNTPEPDPHDGPIRPHSYDGIQEYDKRLPNWWLWTLHGAIIFSVAYWVYFHSARSAYDPGADLAAAMRATQASAAGSAPELSDDDLWKMSQDAGIIAAGQATFATTCASCHQADLSGQIGPNLKDKEWIHGGNPVAVVKTIREGVPAKGMPPWAPILGRKKINEVTAFIMSHHQAGEEVIKVPGWTPPAAK
jgi:cytochrome c oxidase cbb3-type subunit 3